jgi:hypothetical protein
MTQVLGVQFYHFFLLQKFCLYLIFCFSARSNNVVCPGPPSKLQDIRCCVLQAALEYGNSGVSYDVLMRRLQEMGVDVSGQVFAYTNLAALLASMPGLRCIAPLT